MTCSSCSSSFSFSLYKKEGDVFLLLFLCKKKMKKMTCVLLLLLFLLLCKKIRKLPAPPYV